MKTILVPTDFSRSAENALLFASLIALKTNTKIIILHAFQLPLPVAQISYEILKDNTESKQKEILEKLHLEGHKIKKSEELNIEYHAIEGLARNVVLNFINERIIDYIVMGTNGVGKHTSGIFGSTTSHIIENANCPVIAIPEIASFNNEIKKITFATDFHAYDLYAIEKIKELASVFDAQINILHISDTNIPNQEQQTMMYDFTKRVNAKLTYQNMSFQIIEGTDVETKLTEYIKNNETDMLVISTHFRNFLDKIFGKSITKELVLKTTIPLVAFHYDNKV